MKKQWRRLLAVLGISLLAAAVALMPACDIGENCDLQTLNGTWQVSRTTNAFGAPMTQTLTVTIEVLDDSHLIWAEDGGEETSCVISCDNGSVFCQGNLQNDSPYPDCDVNSNMQAMVTLSSADRFTGAYTFCYECSGGFKCCGQFEDSFLTNYVMEAFRL